MKTVTESHKDAKDGGKLTSQYLHPPPPDGNSVSLKKKPTHSAHHPSFLILYHFAPKNRICLATTCKNALMSTILHSKTWHRCGVYSKCNIYTILEVIGFCLSCNSVWLNTNDKWREKKVLWEKEEKRNRDSVEKSCTYHLIITAATEWVESVLGNIRQKQGDRSVLEGQEIFFLKMAVFHFLTLSQGQKEHFKLLGNWTKTEKIYCCPEVVFWHPSDSTVNFPLHVNHFSWKLKDMAEVVHPTIYICYWFIDKSKKFSANSLNMSSIKNEQ